MLNYLEYDQFLTLLAAAKKKSSKLEAIIAVMGYTGLRISETLSLPLTSVYKDDKISRMVYVESDRTKTKRSRDVVINDQLAEILERYLFHNLTNAATSKLLFPSPRGIRMTNRAIQIAIRKLGYQVLERHVTPHTLRHTFGTLLARRASIRVVQEALGHQSLTSTQIYTHVNREDLQRGVAAAFPSTPPSQEAVEKQISPFYKPPK